MIAIRKPLPTATSRALAGTGMHCGFAMQVRGNTPVSGVRLAP
jgi:hypothetical protein